MEKQPLNELSIVRQNMINNINYRPYCLTCADLIKFEQWTKEEQLECPQCKRTTEFPKHFITRYKSTHKINKL